MSINFHANQYEQAFTPHRLQNHEIPKNEQGKYPNPATGFTRIKANDRGHLLPNVPRERASPWGTYVGTWDMPEKIPGGKVTNPTARSEDAVLRGVSSKEQADPVINGQLKRCHTVDPLPVKMDAQEDARPAGTICDPYGINDGQPALEYPCPVVETTHYEFNQPRAMSRKNNAGGLGWPKAKSPGCDSPVGHAMSPKPVTPMAVADINIQEEARRLISPLANNNNNAVRGGLKTPDADLQNRADPVPSPGNRIVGMKSPQNIPVNGSNPHAEAALIS